MFTIRHVAGFGILLLLCADVVSAADNAGSTAQVPIVDTHAHLGRNIRRASPESFADNALAAMKKFNVVTTLIMPPPFSEGHPGVYGYQPLARIAARNPRAFAFEGGGDTLNGMIQNSRPDQVNDDLKRRFIAVAEQTANAGAAGFGEFAAEHISSGRGDHPYESTAPDHPLFLTLADVAARRGLPIELHMEALPRDMAMPPRFLHSPNPEALRANIGGLERLLAHNRDAKIVWAHAGWDLTGERTVDLMRTLLERNSNLYMNIKLDASGRRNMPWAASGGLDPAWLALLTEFADRFMIGSDQFYDEKPDRIESARKFVDALPPELASKIAYENARRIYRLRE